MSLQRFLKQIKRKKNNPKMTFDKMCWEKCIFIARSHGLEIEDTPKPREEVGKNSGGISERKRPAAQPGFHSPFCPD